MTTKAQSAAVLLSLGLGVLLGTACGFGGGGSESPSGPITVPPRTSNPAGMAAVFATANRSDGVCAAARPFYWEIGDRSGLITGGSVDGPSGATASRTVVLPVGSAGEWLYSAFVASRRGYVLTPQDVEFLTMRSGFVSASDACRASTTIGSCAAAGGNAVRDAAAVGRFGYGGSHLQQHASQPAPGMDFAAKDNVALEIAMRSALGVGTALSVAGQRIPEDIAISPTGYASFLRKVLAGELRFGALLGTNLTCTDPATCASAVPTATPLPVTPGSRWSYSVGHWVENDPVTGDGAYSNPGARGFYPWITARADMYGMVVRADSAGGTAASVRCGRVLRAAWVTGVVQ
ncbi:MAG: hypothetical protein IT355_14505 [Gemmatimonadaceae bacterium]|nr:hypothetical protein [Gemmatimonadaceae bacterium]